MNWRRLEGTNVDPEMTEGLSARIADPLWLLARQWQVGEFRGEDAASPVLMQAEVDTTPIARVRIGRQGRPVPSTVPLEPLVEAEAIRSGPAAARFGLEAGVALLATVREISTSAARALAAAYPVRGEIRDRDAELDPVGVARLRMLARRSLDTFDLIADHRTAGGSGLGIAVVAALADDIREAVAAAVDDWAASEAAMFAEPDDGAVAWIDDRLEYRFAVEAGDSRQTIRLDAAEYPGGTLDWFHFDVGRVERGPGEPRQEPVTVEVLASPIQYAGQPASRWWEFEDGDVAFGDLAGGPDDLARSIIASFAAVAGDNWHLIPVTLPVGSLAEVRSVRVLDDFGGRHDVRATAVLDADAATRGGPEARPWRFFELSGDPSVTEKPRRAPLLFLPPVLDTVDAGQPLEAVEFRRDELANLAWGIERRVESAWGRAVDRDAHATHPGPPTTGMWSYTFMTTVPESWIPLVPVRLIDLRWPQMVLRRGAVAHPRGEPRATDPRSVLLGGDGPFLLQEEEIPSGGIRVTRRYQIARDHAGGVHVWVGRKKSPSSGPMRRTPLQFDRLTTI